MSRHVLRVPRSDEESSFVLIQVEPAGDKPLDLKLIATEGEAPYLLKLRHDRISSLRVKSSTVTQQEWESILTSILLEEDPPEDVETTAAVYAESEITVTFRKRVQGITQRLGSFSITHEPGAVIELFELCGLAIAGRDKIRADTAVHRRRIKELENDVAALKKQLDEFISVKESDEAILLEKFRALLNEKKLKIREQQRLLASVAPDKSQLTSTSPPHSPGPSRPSKRKTRLDEEDEDDDSDARAPGDRGPKADEDSTEDRETPGRMSETEAEETADEAEETADEAEETADGAKGGEEGIRPATTRRAAAAPAAKTKKAPSKAGGRGKGRDRGKTAAAKAKASSQAKDDDVPPPRRELPFATRHAAAQRSSKAAERSESETASDEEL